MSYNRRKYYALAAKASKQIGEHPGLLYLQKIAGQSSGVLDVGCGEGSRLVTLLPPDQSGWGVDIDKYAINLAKKQYPDQHFQIYTGEKLPYKSGTFGLVYSAFVLEHVQNPENLLSETIRVCRPGGMIIILCPNFGAPNRRSPNSIQNPILKVLKGFINDFFSTSVFRWEKVQPKPVYNLPDDDTTIEPYLLSLIRFFQRKKLTINAASSLWNLESPSLNPRKIFVKTLGQLGIFPFKYWGPQIFISATKRVSD